MESNDNPQLTPRMFMLNVTYTLWNKMDSRIFHAPVDTVAWHIPHYCEMIKHPMDMRTIRTRLETTSYPSAEECVEECNADYTLMFDNCLTFNRHPENAYRKMALSLREEYNMLMEQLPERMRRRSADIVEDQFVQELPTKKLKRGTREESVQICPPWKQEKEQSQCKPAVFPATKPPTKSIQPRGRPSAPRGPYKKKKATKLNKSSQPYEIPKGMPSWDESYDSDEDQLDDYELGKDIAALNNQQGIYFLGKIERAAMRASIISKDQKGEVDIDVTQLPEGVQQGARKWVSECLLQNADDEMN